MVLVGPRYPATVVVGAALFLGGCATPRTVETAQTPEPIVERWRGLTVATEQALGWAVTGVRAALINDNYFLPAEALDAKQAHPPRSASHRR